LLGCWIVLVVLFFSLSSGKRGVYVLPAVPALALLCAPYLQQLAVQRWPQRAMFLLAAGASAFGFAACAYLLTQPDQRADMIANYEMDPLAPLASTAIATAVLCVIARPWRGLLAACGAIATCVLVVSFWVNPKMNASRSSAAFIARVEATADPQHELGLVAFKEQYVLNAQREIVHFGHARWRDADLEMADAALWLTEGAGRQLLISEPARAACFKDAQLQPMGSANDTQWYIVRDGADPVCVAHGKRGSARSYLPPGAAATRLSS
jgi:4-amino-4-deoxy-L-arabinose transferase-like glycosyltransferase